MEDERDDWELHENDLYLERLGLDLPEPPKKKYNPKDLPDYFNATPRDIRLWEQAQRNIPRDRHALSIAPPANRSDNPERRRRFTRRTEMESFDPHDRDGFPVEQRAETLTANDVLDPEMREYLRKLPPIEVVSEDPIVQQTIVVDADTGLPPMPNLGVMGDSDPNEVRYQAVEVFTVRGKDFRTMEEAVNYRRIRKGGPAGGEIIRGKEGAERLLEDAVDIVLNFIHSPHGKNVVRYDRNNDNNGIKQLLEVCKTRGLIDRYYVDQVYSQDYFSLELRVRLMKWEYHMDYRIDTGMLGI